MDQEPQSGNESNAGTGVLELTATAPLGANVYLRETQADAARFSTIEARADHQAAVAVTATIPDLRLARVQALKARIDAVTYHVTSQQLAAALFGYMRQ